MTIELATVVVTPLAQNSTILADRQAGEAVVVDPGGDADLILERLANLGVRLKEIWLTHSHLDHCGGVSDLLGEAEVPLLGHPDEAEFRAHVSEIASYYGIPRGYMKNCPEPSRMIQGGEVLEFGGERFEVRFTPGHSPGHVVFVCHELNLVIGGDVLFQGSIGRTDLPGGNHGTLLESIRSKIFTLPDGMRVLPGHGPETTIGVEKRTNPFVREP